VSVAADCGYPTSEETNSIITSLEQVGKMLRGMMNEVELFLVRYDDHVEEKADPLEDD
jgi:hypothetical protein